MTTLDQIRADVLARAEHVPLDRSRFQLAAFTGGDEGGTPERRVRALLLNLDSKLQAVEEARFRREEMAVTLDELDFVLDRLDDQSDPQGFERRRKDIARRKAVAGLDREDKLIRDALAEIEAMYAELLTLPRVESREQFEAAEARYWITRLMRVAEREAIAVGRPSAGTIEALAQAGIALTPNERGQLVPSGPGLAALAPRTTPQITETPDVR